MRPWRWILDGALGPACNMAVDEALLHRARAPVLRLYRWEPATLSIGAHQEHEKALDAAWCRAHGIDWVRRPTGGRAVLHERTDWTYALIAPLEGAGAGPFRGLSLLECYRVVGEALQLSLRILGIPTELVRGAPREYPSPRPVPCFVTPSRYELLYGGKKLVGSAQRRLPGAFLQHGSIPVRPAIERLAGATGRPDLPGDFSAAIEPLLGRPLREGELPDALRLGFGERFGVSLEESALSEEERSLARRLERSKYGTEAWNVRRESGGPEGEGE